MLNRGKEKGKERQTHGSNHTIPFLASLSSKKQVSGKDKVVHQQFAHLRNLVFWSAGYFWSVSPILHPESPLS